MNRHRVRQVPLIFKFIFVCASIVSPLHAFFGKTMVLPRSQTINAARELVGWQELINRGDATCSYWALAITPEYYRTLHKREITDYLLGGCDTFTFSGSRAFNRSKCDILSDYFGVPLDYKSKVKFNPVIAQFLVDFNFYYGLSGICSGLYFRIDAPIVHANWDLNFVECPITPGTGNYPAGYMASTSLLQQNLPTTVEEVLEGSSKFGDLQETIKFGKVFNREEKTHISDIQLVLGDNFLVSDWYHAGLNARVYLPVGRGTTSEFFLEPIIGDNRHWQAGIGFTGHVSYESDCTTYGAYLDANVTHLFSAKSCRSYDFKNNHGSRYMLIEQIAPSSSQLFIDGAASPFQYAGQLWYAINKSTLETTTSLKVQVDIAGKLSARRNGWGVDVGYNFWYRSPEKLECRQRFLSDTYAFKGDAQLYGFTAANSPIALNATENSATLLQGQGAGNFVSGSQLQNLNIDNPAQAQGPTAGTALFNITTSDAATFGFARTTVQTSSPPLFLHDSDIDENSVLAPRGLSNKIFAHIGYTWSADACVWVPFLGIGGELEWASHCKKPNSGFSQWGIWIKGGFSRW